MKAYTLKEIKDKHLGKPGSFLRNVQELNFLIVDIQDNFKNIRRRNKLTRKEMAEILHTDADS